MNIGNESLGPHAETRKEDKVLAPYNIAQSLNDALNLERDALRLRPGGHLDRALSCENLAKSLRARFDQTGDVLLLEEALELEIEALHLRPEGHPDRARSCQSLAASLWNRFDQTGDMSFLDEALGLEREALDDFP
jgi:hypothetical protein